MTSDADRFFVSRRSVLIGSIALASVSIPTIAFSQTLPVTIQHKEKLTWVS